MDSIGRHRWQTRASAKGHGLVHECARSQFNVEIGRGVAFPDCESWKVVRQDNQSATVSLNGGNAVKVCVAMTLGKQVAKVGIAIQVFNKEDGTMLVVGKFSSKDRT